MAYQSEPAILPQRYEPKRVPGPASRWSFCRTSSTQMSRSRVTFVTLPATPRPVPSKKRQRFILCNSYRGGFAPLDSKQPYSTLMFSRKERKGRKRKNWLIVAMGSDPIVFLPVLNLLQQDRGESRRCQGSGRHRRCTIFCPYHGERRFS